VTLTSMRPLVYLRLGRVSNLPTVWTNVLAGAMLGGASAAPPVLFALVISVSLAYVGGMFLNDAFDRRIDARERPERPIPSGQVSAAEVFAIGFGLLGASVVAVASLVSVTGVSRPFHAVGAVLVLLALIVVYDAWHKENPASPVVMGACRAAVYVTAALATGGALTLPLLFGAASLGGYVVGLTFVARQENRATFRGIWPLALLAAPVAAALWTASTSIQALMAVALFVAWVVRAVWPLAASRENVNVPKAVISLIAGIALLDGMLGAAHGAPIFVLVGLGGLVATLATQRFVRGT
jgi:4-hydroxybenzoate polyprenyltransferase